MDEAAAAVRSNLATYRDFYGGGPEGEQQLPLLVLNIRRNRLVQDSLQQVSHLPPSILYTKPGEVVIEAFLSLAYGRSRSR